MDTQTAIEELKKMLPSTIFIVDVDENPETGIGKVFVYEVLPDGNKRAFVVQWNLALMDNPDFLRSLARTIANPPMLVGSPIIHQFPPL